MYMYTDIDVLNTSSTHVQYVCMHVYCTMVFMYMNSYKSIHVLARLLILFVYYINITPVISHFLKNEFLWLIKAWSRYGASYYYTQTHTERASTASLATGQQQCSGLANQIIRNKATTGS